MVSHETPPAHGRALRAAAVLALALLAGACAGGRPAEAPVEDRSGQAPAPARPDTGPRAQGVDEGWISGAPEPEPLDPGQGTAAGESDTAVVALLSESDRRRRAGEPEAAAAALERALRIAPGDALLWHRLAGVRLEQRQYPQAENLARKSLSLAGADRQLQAANWRLISRAREALGDASGAAEADRNAARLQQ